MSDLVPSEIVVITCKSNKVVVFLSAFAGITFPEIGR